MHGPSVHDSSLQGELETLDVSFNALTALPPMSGLTKLQTLRLGNNSLSQLPPDFGALTGLRTLKYK